MTDTRMLHPFRGHRGETDEEDNCVICEEYGWTTLVGHDIGTERPVDILIGEISAILDERADGGSWDDDEASALKERLWPILREAST